MRLPHDGLVGLANDVGLFSEEFDPRYRGVGNSPKTTHTCLLTNTARNLTVPQERKTRSR
jgi:hypothetical protein